MQKQIKILLTLLIALFLSVSCVNKNPNNPNNTNNQTPTKEEMLRQNWVYDYGTGCSVYYITEKSFVSANYYKNYEEDEVVYYELAIEEIVWNSDNKSGMIYGKYTIDNYLNYEGDKSKVGKWCAVYFERLTSTRVNIREADISNVYDSAETLEEAKTKFTKENGYFLGFSSLCKLKQ
uniref:hypothetical protein n=1 Tax=Brachyspira catarrhinii TaxID=2528966 RepID=UPI003F4B3C77